MGCAVSSSSDGNGSATEIDSDAVITPLRLSIFYSLSVAMDQTTQINPDHRPSHVPLILTSLVRRIEEMDGFHTEGLFRKSGLKTTVDKIRYELEQGRYEYISESDKNNSDLTVHDMTSVLKLWLRTLNDSLIPQSYLENVIEMGKDPSSITQQSLNEWIRSFPIINRESLKYLISFLQRLIQPEIVEVTRMPVDNYAIVFNSYLIRDPIQDPMKSLQSVRYLTDFTKALISKLVIEGDYSTGMVDSGKETAEQMGEKYTVEGEGGEGAGDQEITGEIPTQRGETGVI